MNQEQLEAVMGLIIHSGNAKRKQLQQLKKEILSKQTSKSNKQRRQLLKRITHKLPCLPMKHKAMQQKSPS